MKKRAGVVFMTAVLLSVLLSGCRVGTETGAGAPGNVSEPSAGADGTEDEAAREDEAAGTQETGGGKDSAGGKDSGGEEDSAGGKEPAGTQSANEQGTAIQSANGQETAIQDAKIQDTETEKRLAALPYQFVKEYGIIKSEYPIYELDAVIESRLPQKGKTVTVTSVIGQKQELIVSMILEDDSETAILAAGEEPPADGNYYTLSDGTLLLVSEGRYQNELWVSGEGIFLTGPGIPKTGIKPEESVYAADPEYAAAYGHMRYFIEAKFELPPIPGDEEPSSGDEDPPSGYAVRLLDFEKPFAFSLKRAPEYGTLKELAAAEQGSTDTHDGITIVSIGEKVKEGILVSWYVYSEERARQISSVIYTPPRQEIDMPTVSVKGKQYPIRKLPPGNPYWDTTGMYGLSEVERYGRRTRCVFDVPLEEQGGAFRMNIPGITFLDQEESPTTVALPIPEDYETVNEVIPWKDGSVRILGITRMKEPQKIEIPDGQGRVKTSERPAVYIDVTAVHEEKDLTLRRLTCQRKLNGTWEHERYDFDGKGRLSGFRIFYNEGDTEVTLKFSKPAFYWAQPYVMELPLTD